MYININDIILRNNTEFNTLNIKHTLEIHLNLKNKY